MMRSFVIFGLGVLSSLSSENDATRYISLMKDTRCLSSLLRGPGVVSVGRLKLSRHQVTKDVDYAVDGPISLNDSHTWFWEAGAGGDKVSMILVAIDYKDRNEKDWVTSHLNISKISSPPIESIGEALGVNLIPDPDGVGTRRYEGSRDGIKYAVTLVEPSKEDARVDIECRVIEPVVFGYSESEKLH